MKTTVESYIQTVKHIKEEILKSRYQIAKVANRELLLLYFKVGNTISEKVATEKRGSKTIEKLSTDLQNELMGLRGFSTTNLKYMKRFFEEWSPYIQENIFPYKSSQSLTDQLKKAQNEISQSLTDQLEKYFTLVNFTAHCEIFMKEKTLEARVFYITKSAQEFWSVRNLKHQIKNKLFETIGQLPNNFGESIVNTENQKQALLTFRDHYLFDFIRISDEEAEDEKLLENEIVNSIKQFIMSLGNDFAFIGNQYRLIVDEEEFFIDLLFFNRKLQALVAFDLKTGKFKPEYLGKMNFYLSVLDDQVKMENESPSIGIFLCKEKKNKIVEFAFRNFSKAMGVATYTTSNKLPAKYKNILPDEKALKKLME